jgi:hypothetical protein
VRSSSRPAVVVPDRFSDHGAALPLQGGDLDAEVLIRGTDPGVADGGHGASRLDLDPPIMPSQNIKVNPIETRFLSRGDDPLGYTRMIHAAAHDLPERTGGAGHRDRRHPWRAATPEVQGPCGARPWGR